MTSATHQLVRDFVAALSAGDLPDALLTDDARIWTTSSGMHIDKARYQFGVRLLGSVFQDGGKYTYTVKSITAEDDRAAAEVDAQGTLITGEPYGNTYVFMFRIRDGKIASVAEHFNPIPVHEKVAPLLQAAMAKSAG